MQRVKKQHFVPQLYLNNFTNSEDELYVFDKISRKEFRSRVENIGFEKYFYDFEPLDNLMGNQYVETLLHEFETSFGAILGNIIKSINNNNFNGLTEEHRYKMAEYIILQIERTQQSRSINDQFSKELEAQLLSKGFTEDSIMQNKLDSSSFDSKEFQIQSMLSPIKEPFIKEFCENNWVFWRNETNLKFLTSDHPVVGYTHSDISDSAYEIFIPLTPTIGLSILGQRDFSHYKSKHDRITNLENTEFIRFYNSLMATKCHRHLFSCDNNFEVVK